MRIAPSPRQAFAVVAIAFIVLYLIGGADGIRQVRSRIRAWLQPPTADQMQQAEPETVVALPPAALPRAVVGKKLWLSDPPSKTAIAGALTSIIVGAVVLMFFTGRSSHPSSKGSPSA